VQVAHGLGREQGVRVGAGGEQLLAGIAAGGEVGDAWWTSGWSTRPRRLPAIDHAWHGGEAISPRTRPEKIHTG
jgi:hypothetical protein